MQGPVWRRRRREAGSLEWGLRVQTSSWVMPVLPARPCLEEHKGAGLVQASSLPGMLAAVPCLGGTWGGGAQRAGCAADVLGVLEEPMCQRQPRPMFDTGGVEVGALNRTGQPSEKEPCKMATASLCDLGAPYPVCPVSPSVLMLESTRPSSARVGFGGA